MAEGHAWTRRLSIRSIHAMMLERSAHTEIGLLYSGIRDEWKYPKTRSRSGQFLPEVPAARQRVCL